jgi:hypothetical protein
MRQLKLLSRKMADSPLPMEKVKNDRSELTRWKCPLGKCRTGEKVYVQ